MIKYENIVTSVDYEEQQVILLVMEVVNILHTILCKEGWNPSQEELTKFEKAIVDYSLSYRKAIENFAGEWNVVIGNYKLKRTYEEKRGVTEQGNKIKRQLDKATRILYKNFREIGVMSFFKKAPVFSVIITSYIREREHQKDKTLKMELIRTNSIKYSFGYGMDHKKVFKEVLSI